MKRDIARLKQEVSHWKEQADNVQYLPAPGMTGALLGSGSSALVAGHHDRACAVLRMLPCGAWLGAPAAATQPPICNAFLPCRCGEGGGGPPDCRGQGRGGEAGVGRAGAREAAGRWQDLHTWKLGCSLFGCRCVCSTPCHAAAKKPAAVLQVAKEAAAAAEVARKEEELRLVQVGPLGCCAAAASAGLMAVGGHWPLFSSQPASFIWMRNNSSTVQHASHLYRLTSHVFRSHMCFLLTGGGGPKGGGGRAAAGGAEPGGAAVP